MSTNLSNIRTVVNFFCETIQVLDVQGNYAQSRDPWVISLMLEKLDRETKRLWADVAISKPEPTLDEFLTFLKERCSAIESYNPDIGKATAELRSPQSHKRSNIRVHSSHKFVAHYDF